MSSIAESAWTPRTYSYETYAQETDWIYWGDSDVPRGRALRIHKTVWDKGGD